jgi:two-component system cell cycle sensor histidine kinase/response regulator CckA
MASILTPRFPDHRRRPSAPCSVEYERTGRAAKRRRQLARQREKIAHELVVVRRTGQVADVLAEAARIVADATSARGAVARVLRAAVDRLGVEFAAAWCVDPRTHTLRCAVGASARPEVSVFDAISRARAFGPGIGLPGRVWHSGSAAWIPDLETDDNFPRVLDALGAGLRSGIAVPVRRGGRTIGAVELFTASTSSPDLEFLRRLGGLGDLIGLVLDPEQPGHFGISP